MTQNANSAPAIDKAKIKEDVSWIGARLREPSTYAGLAVLLGLLGLHDVPEAVKDVSEIGMGLGGLIAIFLPEVKKAVNGAKNAAQAAIATDHGQTAAVAALCVAAACIFVVPAMAANTATPVTPKPAVSSKATVAQAQQNPLVVLRQFTVADLQTALADAQAQTPPDTVAVTCYTALIPFVQSQMQNPLPTGAGVFQALQKARDAKAYLANIQSPTGPLAGLNIACAPLVLDVQSTLVTLGVAVGVIANPAGAAATLSGLPAAVAVFLGLPNL
jgi:hypothetical protein